MPHVTCPGCGRRINLCAEDLSRTVECARCDTRFRPAAERVRVTCPGCQAGIRIPAAMLGKRVTCPRCREAFEAVPAEEPVADPEPKATTSEPSPAGPELLVNATCPGCGRTIPLQPHELSLTVECARCNTRFTPKGPGMPPPVRHAPGESAETGRQSLGYASAYPDYRPARTAPSMKIAVGGIACLGLFAIVLVILIAFALSGNQGKRPAPDRRAGQEDRQAPVLQIEPASPNTAAWAGIGFMAFLCIFFLAIAWLVGVILALIYVAKDSRSRGQDSGPMWIIVLLLTGVIGLLIYLASRPAGALIVCHHCHNKRLTYV